MALKLSFTTIPDFSARDYISPCRHRGDGATRRFRMKFMAIASIVQPLSPEQRQQIMPNEVPATLKLYLDGKIEQFWYRHDAPGVIFLMNVESVEQAKATVEALPLVTGGFGKE